MNIAKLNERITLQRNMAIMDAVGNHRAVWADYFRCACSVAASNYIQKESENAGTTSAAEQLIFTVRYCSELANIDATHYRIVFRKAVYNITSVDMVNYGRTSIKLTANREVRQNVQ